MTIEEFGRQIKTKYPAYRDMPDKEIGEKMINKYPQYGNLVNRTQTKKAVDPFLSGHPVLKGISDFVGTTGLGKGIAQGIFLKFTPEGKDLIEQMKRGEVTQKDIEEITGAVATPRQIIGSAGQTALNFATLGGAGLAGKFGVRALKTAGLGAGFGASSALEDGGGIKEVAAGALSGAAFGGALSGIGAGLSSLGRNLTEKLPRRLMQSAVGQSKNALMAGKDVSEYALKNAKMGTADKLIREAQEATQKLSNDVEKLLASTPGTVRILKNEIIKEVTERVNSEGGQITAKEVSKILGNLAPQAKGLLSRQSMSLTEANRLRQALDKTIGDRGFLTSQLPFNKDVIKSFTNSLRERVKSAAPVETREIFAELSKEITLRDALLSKYAGQAKNQVLNAFDIMIAGGGFLGGGGIGAATAVATKKIAQSAIGKTTLSVLLNRLGNVGPILQKFTPAERTVIMNAFSALLSGGAQLEDKDTQWKEVWRGEKRDQ